jgi:hypothetical protein
MSNEFFWNLTYKDFGDSFYNSLYGGVTLFTGMAVAAVANVVVRSLLSNDNSYSYIRQFIRNSLNSLSSSNSYTKQRNISLKDIAITLIGIGAGVVTAVHVANRLPYVTFAAEKALKFSVLTLLTIPTKILPLITFGGIASSRTPFYISGAISALIGSISMTVLDLHNH